MSEAGGTGGRALSKADRAARLLDRTPLGRLIRRAGAWRGLLVLNYHRIGDGSRSPYDRGVFSTTAEELDGHLRLLAREAEVVDPDSVAEVLSRGRGRHVLLTFDDGYRDNFEHAFPLLRRHGLPACFFLATGFIDRPRASWWDEVAWMVRSSARTGIPAGPDLPEPVDFDEPERERAVGRLLEVFKGLPGERTEHYLDFLAEAGGSGRLDPRRAAAEWMSWDMARKMRDGGMRFGGHTVTHPVLAGLDGESQRREIAGCRERIEAELGLPMRLFSYPVGLPEAFDDRTRAALRAEGVEQAFSFYGGYRRPSDRPDPYDVPRTSVWRAMDEARFRAVITLPQLFARW